MLTQQQFSVLYCCQRTGSPTQRIIVEEADISLEAVNATLRELKSMGLVTEGNAVTPRGVAALEPYKVDNAVIMAAGLSSRFAPISYERPKGLLRVRGEVLIERQIELLLEAGVADITVVVGYKKELFFYLEDKYGVQIAVNPEFASRNNNSTLMHVRGKLGNTYICSSDDYFTENPFERYVWKSYYAAEYSEGPTEEWCLSVDTNDRIVGIEVGGNGSWYMIGHAYFDRAFSERFLTILEAEYNDSITAGKLWEQIYVEHLGELDMEIRRYPPGTIHEFDSLDELRDFDPEFINNLDSEIFDNICRVLGCARSEIRNVYPLKQGLTNLSCHFTTDGGEWVYRHPGAGTEQMIDRRAEVAALELACSIGVDPTYVYADPLRGWKISRFIQGSRELNPHDESQLAEAMAVARKLHESGAVLDRNFDYLEESFRYESLLLAKGPIEIPDYQELRALAQQVKEFADADGLMRCLTHNDFFNLNLLYDCENRLSLIDWEYAGMADYASDYGTFVVTCRLSREEAERALECYFGREPTLEECRHNYAYVGLAGWCWYVWALQKESEGDYVGDWLYTYYRYAKEYLSLAISAYQS